MDPTSLRLKRARVAGDLNEVRRLLDEGADPDSTDEHGSGTLLTFHPEVIEYLLSKGADPDIQTNENGASVLAGFAYVNQLECVRLLLRAGADPDRGRDVSGETPLHHALGANESDRSALVKLLLDHGADANAKTKPGIVSFNFWRHARTRGETPLHRAAAFAPTETIELLLAAGADPTIRDVNGDSPLAWASWHLRDRTIIDLVNSETNKHKKVRQTLCVGLIAFIVGFFTVLLMWDWLIARVHPGHPWWNFSRVGLEDIVVSIFGGLCFAVASS